MKCPKYEQTKKVKKNINTDTVYAIALVANDDFSRLTRLLNFKVREEDEKLGQSFVSGDSCI